LKEKGRPRERKGKLGERETKIKEVGIERERETKRNKMGIE